MREIKFRAWCNHPESDCGFYHHFKVGEQLYFSDLCVDFFVIEEFTGLKDARGKDIYEGDILKCGESIKIVRHNNDIDTDRFWEIASGFIISFDPTLTDNKGFKVIGNIHENQELLK